MILGIFRISGHSMMPVLKPNDKIVISSLPYFFSQPKVGDVILLRYNGKILVKRIAEISNAKLLVVGDNKKDSLKTNPIERNDILGKVILSLNS